MATAALKAGHRRTRRRTAPTSPPPATAPCPELALSDIDPPATNRHIAEGPLEDLAESIRQFGVCQPITVRRRAQRYQIVFGERRFRAAGLAGLTTIPALIRDLDDRAVQELQIVENLQREDIHPLEEADAYQALLDSDPTCTPDVIARRIGKRKAYVYQRLTLRRLIPAVRDAFTRNIITTAHANRLAEIPESLQSLALTECFFPILAPNTPIDALNGDDVAPIRQLDAWIRSRVQLKPYSEDVQVFLPQLAEAVSEADTHSHGNVLPLSTLHNHTDKTDPKPILVSSWRTASGKQRCPHAQPGVIVLGEGRGTLLQVCIAKKQCAKHWPPRTALATVDRQKQAAAEERARAEREQQEQERHFYEDHWRPALLTAILKRTAALKVTPPIVALVLEHFCSRPDELQRLIGPIKKVTPARLPQALAVAIALSRSWQIQQLAPIARRLGVDPKAVRRQAVRAQTTAQPLVRKSA